ncbi:hypothetical protein L596_024591 [Steinernema carpocapsae]|uniref:Uncharacterized protein n=1 Tax=Steinernema carpocapsae TaxID=34508 RepID=A0A4U5MIE0_STECR|nr:hypothetical protein L596_024591 [Steinernema carpocapsae]
MWRFVRNFLNQEHVIREMADSRPMRLAARFAVSGFFRGREALMKNFVGNRIGRIANSTKTRFEEEFKKSMEQKKLK